VVDHHVAKESRVTCTLVNPRVNDAEDAPWQTLCTAGLVFKLVHGVLKVLRLAGDERGTSIAVKDYLDLAALGTIADLVPLRTENRILAAHGLKALGEARRQGLRPAGVIPVDLFGLAADYDAIEAIAAREGLWVVADSAQGYGARYKGRRTGSIGTIATTSFFPAKPLGCYGDGGAIFTHDDDLAKLIDSLRVHGKGSDKYDNVRIGLNSRLDTLQAGILLEKLAIYEDEIAMRQVVAQRYTNALSNLIATPVVPADCASVWAQYTLRATDGAARDRAMAGLKAAGIPTMVYYPRPLHTQSAYVAYPRDPNGLPTAESLASRVFSLPMHPYLTEADQDLVIAALTESLK
jgi:dTDP-4-amino-4,6-dideoxygalactose transaminase